VSLGVRDVERLEMRNEIVKRGEFGQVDGRALLRPVFQDGGRKVSLGVLEEVVLEEVEMVGLREEVEEEGLKSMSRKITRRAGGGKTYDSGFNTDETSPVARIGPLVSAIRAMYRHVRWNLQSPTHANGKDVEKPCVVSCGVDLRVDWMPCEDWTR
jgi:hypothetical protein